MAISYVKFSLKLNVKFNLQIDKFHENNILSLWIILSFLK
jgi:hypothetical protein